jgi:predicted SnoaL-like aldol condensation-catalyzing enzyme
MANQLEQNKETVKAFYDLAFNQNNPAEAVAKYTGDMYIQHNPGIGDGKQGFIDTLTRLAKEYPGKKVHILRSFAEGNYVVVHCCEEWPGDNDWASIDIFRFDDQGKIVEHWNTVQRVPDTSANENTMF